MLKLTIQQLRKQAKKDPQLIQRRRTMLQRLIEGNPPSLLAEVQQYYAKRGKVVSEQDIKRISRNTLKLINSL